MPVFISAEKFNTQELAARGSLGAFLRLLNPECSSTGERMIPRCLRQGSFIDSDNVTLSNLNCQFLYINRGIGRLKADTSKEKLLSLNSEIEIHAFNERLTDANAADILKEFLSGEENCFFHVNGRGLMMTGGLDTKLCPDDKIDALLFADAG